MGSEEHFPYIYILNKLLMLQKYHHFDKAVLSTTGLIFFYSDDVICIYNQATTLRKLDLLEWDIWFDFESFSSEIKYISSIPQLWYV